MAEFCLTCWNEKKGRNDPPSKYMISEDLDLCEGCGKLTHVILMERHEEDRMLLKRLRLLFQGIRTRYRREK